MMRIDLNLKTDTLYINLDNSIKSDSKLTIYNDVKDNSINGIIISNFSKSLCIDSSGLTLNDFIEYLKECNNSNDVV